MIPLSALWKPRSAPDNPIPVFVLSIWKDTWSGVHEHHTLTFCVVTTSGSFYVAREDEIGLTSEQMQKLLEQGGMK